MSIPYFIHFQGTADAGPALIAAVQAELRSEPIGSPVVVLHTPITLPGSDPLPVDQDERLLLCQYDAAASYALALKLDAIGHSIEGVRDITHQAMTAEYITPGGPEDPSAPAEAVSFFVQYNGPAKDADAFHAYYRAHHVPIVLRMPGVRALTYYTPMAWETPAHLKRVDHLQLVQAVFDDAESLLKMRQSAERREGLQDFANYPAFEGPVTHQAMRSRRVSG